MTNYLLYKRFATSLQTRFVISHRNKTGLLRMGQTSSQPPSSDGPKKPNRDQQKRQRKRSLKYNHPGTTRNGFGWINHTELWDVQSAPMCGGAVERQPQGSQRQQVAELVLDLVEVWEYERPGTDVPPAGGRVTRTCRSASERGLVMVDG